MTPDRSDVLYGTLGLMVIKTLEALGPLHGYRIARRIEQISGNQLALNQGTLYPALLKLEQMGWITSRWGTAAVSPATCARATPPRTTRVATSSPASRIYRMGHGSRAKTRRPLDLGRVPCTEV